LRAGSGDPFLQFRGPAGVGGPQRVVQAVTAPGAAAAMQNTCGKLRRFAF